MFPGQSDPVNLPIQKQFINLINISPVCFNFEMVPFDPQHKTEVNLRFPFRRQLSRAAALSEVNRSYCGPLAKTNWMCFGHTMPGGNVISRGTFTAR